MGSSRSSSVAMSATPDNKQAFEITQINASANAPSSNMLAELAQSVTQSFDNLVKNVTQPQQAPYMQLAGAGGVPIYDNSNVMKFQNANLNKPSGVTTPTVMQAGAESSKVSSSSSSARSSVKMYAGPQVSGASNMSVNMNHMDDAMVAKMGINGFGRIGRLVFRSTFMGQADKGKVVAINAPGKDLKYLKYLLEFDSVHGRFPGTVEIGDGCLIVNGETVKVFDERDPANCKWGDAGAEYLCESTGVFLTKDSIAGHQAGGVKKVVFAAPAKDDTPTFVFGVNHTDYDSSM